jgi:hypothetical protein
MRCALCLESVDKLDVNLLCQTCSWMDWSSPLAFAVAKTGKYRGKAVYWIREDDPKYYKWAAKTLPEFIAVAQAESKLHTPYNKDYFVAAAVKPKSEGYAHEEAEY